VVVVVVRRLMVVGPVRTELAEPSVAEISVAAARELAVTVARVEQAPLALSLVVGRRRLRLLRRFVRGETLRAHRERAPREKYCFHRRHRVFFGRERLMANDVCRSASDVFVVCRGHQP